MESQSSIELTRQAIALKKAGDTPGAIPLLVQAIKTTPNFEAAWLWLAVCLSEPGEQRYCLEQALNANPDSQQARVGLLRFEQIPSVRPSVLDPEPVVPPDIAPLAAVVPMQSPVSSPPKRSRLLFILFAAITGIVLASAVVLPADSVVVLVIVLILLATVGLFAVRYYTLRAEIIAIQQEHTAAAQREAQAQLEQWRTAAERTIQSTLEQSREAAIRDAQAQLQQWRETDMLRVRAELFELARQEALAQLAQWRENDAVVIRTEQYELAQREALMQFEQWKVDEEKKIRVDAVRRSQSVVMGRVTEHFIPYLPEFHFNPKDARFFGSPVDFLVFDGMDEGDIRQIVFVEIKTGKSTLTTRERQIRDALQAGHVRWVELRTNQMNQDTATDALPLLEQAAAARDHREEALSSVGL